MKHFLAAIALFLATPAMADEKKDMRVYVNATIAAKYCGVPIHQEFVAKEIIKMANRHGIDPMVMAKNISDYVDYISQFYTRDEIRNICKLVALVNSLYGGK